MEQPPSTPSFAGPSRNSRRIRGTPASASRFGHSGNAVAASGSPYARRPQLERDPSSHTLSSIEAGRDIAKSAEVANAPPASVYKADRRKSAGPEGLLGRVRKSLGWLVGRSTSNTTAEDDEAMVDHPSRKMNDEENAVGSSDRVNHMARSSNGSARLEGPSAASLPPFKRNFVASPPIGLYGQNPYDAEESVSPKRMRSSHSTLNLPTQISNPSHGTPLSPGSTYSRQTSPLRYVPPPSRLYVPPQSGRPNARSSIFLSGPLGLPVKSQTSEGGAPGSARSASPGMQHSPVAFALPASASSSVFGLQSQSPFRAGARSPELPVSLLEISSGIARSPSLPRERLSIPTQNSSRFYPYQRSSSVLSSGSRNPALPVSYSIGSGLSGSKRAYASISRSPPKLSPVRSSFYPDGLTEVSFSPGSTGFSTGHSHRAKRQRLGMVWDPDKGFISGDAEGWPTEDLEVAAAPKNEAERILERLEKLRAPQLEGLRNRSPKRINIPLPAHSAVVGDSMFADRISASKSLPTLAANAITPSARRLLAVQEESAAQRDRLKAKSSLGERLRKAQMEKGSRDKEKRSQSSRVSNETEEHTFASQDRNNRPNEMEEKHDVEQSEMPPQPPKRRTRQRTRELSVLSDNSRIDEESEGFSPRRSTRAKGKASAIETSSEHLPQVSEKGTAKNSNSHTAKAKAPETNRASELKKSRNVTEQKGGLKHDERTTRSGRRLQSPNPASPESRIPTLKPARRSRSVSAEVVQEKNPPSIEQIISPGSKDSRRVAAPETSTSSIQKRKKQPPNQLASVNALVKRPINGYAFDEEMDNIEEDPAFTKSDNFDTAKLKLPSSVFANRFSFGKIPISPLSAAEAYKPSDDKTLADKLEARLPQPSLPANPLNKNNPSSSQSTEQKRPVEPKPVFSFSPVAPQFTFANGPSGVSASSEPQSLSNGAVSSDTEIAQTPRQESIMPPLFTFNAPTPASEAPAVSEDPKLDAPPTTNITTTDSSSGESARAPPFSFGGSFMSQQKDRLSSTAAFNFSPSAEKKDFNLNAINANGSANPTSSAIISAVASTSSFAASPSAPSSAANFFSTNIAPVSKDTDRNRASNEIGGKGHSVEPESNTTKTAFDTSKPTFSGFNFTSATATPAKASSAVSLPAGSPDAMQESPPAAPPQSASAAAPFSPVLASSKQPSFSFMPPAKTVSTSGTGGVPAFSFAPAVTPTSQPTNPFASTSASIDSTKRAFSFGGGQAESKSNATPVPDFSFSPSVNLRSDSTTASKSAFSFGQPPGSASSASNIFTSNTSIPSGNSSSISSQPPTANVDPKPSFNFGGQSSLFNFGANKAVEGTSNGFTLAQPSTNTGTSPTVPSFSFGGGNPGNSVPISSFSFMPNANTGTQSSMPVSFGGSPSSIANEVTPKFTFGAGTASASPLATPTTPGGSVTPSAGFFNMGSGGEDPNSPNKARRQIKPLRQRRA